MSKEKIHTGTAPLPSGAYSQAIKAGGFIFTAGLLPVNPLTRQIDAKTIEEQTIQVLENIQAILRSADAGMADVVKVSVYLSDLSHFPRFNEVYLRYIPDPKPARTTVGSQLSPGVLVEIDATAYVGEQ